MDHPLVDILHVIGMISTVCTIGFACAAFDGSFSWWVCILFLEITVLVGLLMYWCEEHFDEVHNQARDAAYARANAVRAVYVPPAPIPPPPPSSGITSVPIAPSSSVDSLIKLRDSCLPLFAKQPFKWIPRIAIEPTKHFSGPNVLAHSDSSNNVICFNSTYLINADYSSLANTMKHELLHAWIDQHEFIGHAPHGDLFKAACFLLGITYDECYRQYDAEKLK